MQYLRTLTLVVAAALLVTACGPTGADDDQVAQLDVSPKCQAVADAALDTARWEMSRTDLEHACELTDILACTRWDHLGQPVMFFIEGADITTIEHEQLHVALECETGDADGEHRSKYWR